MPPGAKEAPRCLIVDDHPVVRAGIRVVLENAFAGSSVSEVASLDEAGDDFNGGSLDVVIIDPWRAGVDVGEMVGRVQSHFGAPVAQELGLSTETVRTHTKRILAKLEASTRTQAVAIGIRHGLIE